jgi:hypothetical protein
VALKLAETFKRVIYQHPPAIKGFPDLNSSIIGDGFENLETVEEFWPMLDEISLFVFPDIGQSKLQEYLESQGKAVWGSRSGDSLEINRQKFNRVLGDLGLPVAKHVVIKGLTNLRLHLRDLTDKYIKVSKYRGTCETQHWRDYDLDSGWLDALAVKLGPAQDLLPFLVFDPIDATVEVGGDTYCVDGQWPSLMLHGLEAKDRCYFGAVTEFDAMPDELKGIMEAFSPVLAKDRYRNQWSMETRDGRFTDATCRGGLPSTASQLNTWENFADIIWRGANGELVEPVPKYNFSVECILTLKSKPHEWGKIRVPKELAGAVQFAACCEIDGAICFPPDGHSDNDVGWLVAGGDTMEEAIDEMNRLAGLLPDGLEAATMDLVSLIESMHKAEDAGLEFSDDKIPEPEKVVA